MKLSFLIMFLALSIWPAKAQDADYRPFIEDGKVWVSKCDKDLSLEGLPVENPGDKPYSYLILYNYFDGDTIVGGRTCKRWIQKYVGPKSGNSKTYVVPVYEEDRRVGFYFEEGVGPFLMYDFGAEVGDSMIVVMPDIQVYSMFKKYNWMDDFWDRYKDTLVIRSAGEEIHGGKKQITTHFSSVRLDRKETSEEDRYVDQNYFMSGIGPQWYPLWNFCVINNTQSPWLIYCVVGNEILYEDSLRAEYWNIPLPTSITAPHFDASSENRSSSSANWADLSGRQLSSPPTRPGLYIKDGRKVMIK